MAARPKLIVFDLDYTLWPYWCDTHIEAPFMMSKKIFTVVMSTCFLYKCDGTVKDRCGRIVEHYPEVPQVLQRLKDQGYVLGVASRTGEVQGANELIRLFGWEKFFTYKEIYPGCKITHFTKLRHDSGFGFDEMLFFDDERRNQIDLSKIGVLMTLVDERVGVTQAVIDKGLQEFAARAARQ